jgi:glycerol-3-phosphate dehydrogenase (NAD(P)+)
MAFERIAVVGAGAWGCALANTIARAGRAVTLCTRERAGADALLRSRESPRLPGIRIEERIAVAPAIAVASFHEIILLAVPAQELRAVMRSLASRLAAGTPVIACAKGIERDSRKFMTEVIAECAPAVLPAILSGPSFAADVARGLPTAVTLAAADQNLAAAIAGSLGSAQFRLYHTSDVRGVEIGGAAKNVLAIAAGIVSGRGLGASAAAALTTRGFAELFRFGKALGAQPETLTGLSGLGDLILTCGGEQSRNFSYGLALGRGATPAEAARTGKLAEGTLTAAALVAMAEHNGVDMPITGAVAGILDQRLAIDAAIETLLARPFRAER